MMSKQWLIMAMVVTLCFPQVSVAADVSSLEKQIAALKEQIASLQHSLVLQTGVVKATTTSIGDSLTPVSLAEDFRVGSTGSAVAVIQLVLAQEPGMYPEKLVSGYYGSLTAKAVRLFERSRGLPETGVVSGETKKKFNEAIREANVFMNSSGSYCTASAVTGLSKKSNTSYVSVCAGSMLMLGSGGVVAQSATGSPSFFYVDVYDVTGTSAKIALGVDRPVRVIAYYAPTTERVDDKASFVESRVFQKIHALPLISLKKGVSYNLYVLVTDTSGNTATSSMKSFKTVADVDTVAPVVLDVRARDVATSSAMILWRTNETSQKKLYVAPTQSFSFETAKVYGSQVYTTSHAFLLQGLRPETEYAFVIESEDVKGNKLKSDRWTFKTLENDMLPPVFVSVAATPRSGGKAEVTIVTNEPTQVALHYGNSDPLDIGTASYQFSATKSTIHAFTLVGLQQKSTYRLVVSAVDKVGNRATSTQQSFTAY